MGSVTLYPNTLNVSVIYGTAPTLTLVGAASNVAALDASTSSYLQYAGGTLSGVPVFTATWNDVRASIPSTAKITGIAFRQSLYIATGSTDRFWQPYRSYSNFSALYDVRYYYSTGIGTLTKNSTFVDYTTPIVAKSNSGGTQGPYYWDYLLADNSFDLTFETFLAGAFDSTGGITRLGALAAIIYYDDIPTVSNVAVNSTAVSSPTVTWTYADSDGTPQSKSDVVVVPSGSIDASGKAAGVAGFDPTTVPGANLQYVGVPGAQTSQNIYPQVLANGATYYAYARSHHAVNDTTLASAWASTSFTTSFTVPPTPTTTVLAQSSLARNRIHAQDEYTTTYGAVNDNMILERSLDGGTTWTQLQDAAAAKYGLYTSGSSERATYPDGAALDITSRVGLQAIGVRVNNYTNFMTIMSKWSTSAGNYSYALCTANGTGAVVARWSHDGSTLNQASATITLPNLMTSLGLTFPYDEISLYADIDATTTSYSIKFYYSLDKGTTWTQLGTTVTGTAASAGIFSGTANVAVGGVSGGVIENFLGSVERVRILNGTTTVLDKNFTEDPPAWNATSASLLGGWTALNGATTIRGLDYEDNTVPSGTTATYRTRGWGIASSGGAPLFSAYSGTATGSYTVSGWTIKGRNRTDLVVNVDLVDNAIDFEAPKEKSVYKPLGSSRYVVVSDGTRGYQGTLKIQVPTRTVRDALKALYETDDDVILQSPYAEWTTGKVFAMLGWKQKMDDPTMNGYWRIEIPVVEVP